MSRAGHKAWKAVPIGQIQHSIDKFLNRLAKVVEEKADLFSIVFLKGHDGSHICSHILSSNKARVVKLSMLIAEC